MNCMYFRNIYKTLIRTMTHGYFWRWEFAKGDSNCCIFIPYEAVLFQHNPVLDKNPAHVPSNQAINTKKGKIPQYNILLMMVLQNLNQMLHWSLNCTN